MARKLKVYGGWAFRGREQVRLIVAATSMVKAAEAVGMTGSTLRAYWSVTGNAVEIKLATAQPGIPLRKAGPMQATPSEDLYSTDPDSPGSQGAAP